MTDTPAPLSETELAEIEEQPLSALAAEYRARRWLAPLSADEANRIHEMFAQGLEGVEQEIVNPLLATVRALQQQNQELIKMPRQPLHELLTEMRHYLDTRVEITSANIGDIRRSLFMPFDCAWNGIVRDETAKREISTPRQEPL